MLISIAIIPIVSGACASSSTHPRSSSRSSPSTRGQQRSASQTVDPALRSTLPASVRKAGALTVGTSADYPPFESLDTTTGNIVGFDPDLGHAIGQVLGIRLRFVNASFDGLIPGLSAGKYQALMAGLQDVKQREQVVSFVDYAISGGDLAVQKGDPQRISTFGNLCGKALGVQAGTTLLAFAEKQPRQCTAAGKPAIALHAYTSENTANLALTSHRVAAVFAESPAAAVAVSRSGGEFQIVGPIYQKGRVGIAIPKRSGSLARALKGAVQTLIDDGTYVRLLRKWHLTSSGIPRALINQPLS